MQPYPWQQSQWKLITQQCSAQWVPNAFLLMGPEGLGKTAFAMALAQWLLCEDRQPEKACECCRSCQWMKSQTHPDFLTLFPQGAQSIIKIDQVRYLIDQLAQTPVQSHHQISLIAPAEAMNTAAANALLKTLEEPSGRVIFILVSHHPGQIPLTIRSRVQSVSFSVPPGEIVQAWLQTQVSGSNTGQLLSIAGGLPLKALSLAEQDPLLSERHLLFDALTQLIRKQTHSVEVVEKLLKFDLSELLKHWFSIVIDLMRLTMGANAQYLMHQDKIEALTFFAEHISIRSLIYYQHELREALRNYSNHPNLNQTLLLEYLFIQWRKMCS